jgi:hypothetical protein
MSTHALVIAAVAMLPEKSVVQALQKTIDKYMKGEVPFWEVEAACAAVIAKGTVMKNKGNVAKTITELESIMDITDQVEKAKQQ